MNHSPSALAVWVVLTLYFLFLLYICSDHLQRLRVLGRRVNYGIADIWASILGLTPTLILVGNLSLQDSTLDAYLLVIFLSCAQLAGMFLARVDYLVECAKNREPETVLVSAGCILIGAMFYSIALAAGFAVAFFLLPATVAYLVCYGFGDVPSPKKRKALNS